MLIYIKFFKQYLWLIYLVCICIYIHTCLDFTVLLCDSNNSIDVFFIDNATNATNEKSNNQTYSEYSILNKGLVLKFRRRVS